MRFPCFPGALRKNDALFMYGSQQRKPFVYIYKQSNLEIVLGPSCSVQNEIIHEHVLADGVSVMERRGGGGTVVLAPGMVVTIVVGERTSSQNAIHIFDKIHVQMIRVFKEMGIDSVVQKGISDLAINNKKILGSSLYMGANPRLFYYQSSLMVESDINIITRYLTHPPREPDYRIGRTHGEFCTTITNEGFPVTVADICDVFNSKLPGYLDATDIQAGNQ